MKGLTNASGGIPAGGIGPAQIADGAVSSSFTVLLTAAGWADNAQTVPANGVTENNTVIISPAPDNYEAYAEGVVRCTAQGGNLLSFACEDIPAGDITVNVTVINK